MNHLENEISIIENAEESAKKVLSEAMWAANQETFAVGGLIVENSTGHIIKKMHNNVLMPLSETTNKPFTFDPTAHGERQLVYWYYENKERLNLPEPDKLTVITTLDPCAMCAGTLLTAGFNVAVVAIDDFAGINYDESFSFEDLPPNLRPVAKSTFGYYSCGNEKIDPPMYVRQYVGSKNVAFYESTVSSQSLMGCGDIFQASVNSVRDSSSDSGLAPDELSNPVLLPDDSPVKVKYREIYPDAFKLSIPNTRLPNQEIYNLLLKTKESTPGAKNAVAFLDPFGNVVLSLADTFSKGPVYTAFMNVTQAYSITRFNLMNDKSSIEEAQKVLTHPKYGTFVFLHAPNPNDSTTIMTLGAYGSTMEGEIPQIFPSNFQYFNPPSEGTIEDLRKVIMNLPPFYTQLVQISVMQTATK